MVCEGAVVCAVIVVMTVAYCVVAMEDVVLEDGFVEVLVVLFLQKKIWSILSIEPVS